MKDAKGLPITLDKIEKRLRLNTGDEPKSPVEAAIIRALRDLIRYLKEKEDAEKTK